MGLPYIYIYAYIDPPNHPNVGFFCGANLLQHGLPEEPPLCSLSLSQEAVPLSESSNRLGRQDKGPVGAERHDRTYLDH